MYSDNCKWHVNTEEFWIFAISLIRYLPLRHNFHCRVRWIDGYLNLDDARLSHFGFFVWNLLSSWRAIEPLDTGVDIWQGECGTNVAHAL